MNANDSETSSSGRCEAVRVVFEFEDGETQVATGKDAEKWTRWFNEGVSWAVTRGRSPPNIEFDSVPEWMETVEGYDTDSDTL